MQTKSYVLIAATLIIGIAIGFLGNGYLTHQKFQKFVHQSGEKVFKNRMMEVIQPADAQLETIEPILEKYDSIAQQNFFEMREKMSALRKEMSRELEAHIEPHQKEALEKWEQSHRERREKYKRNRNCER